jgi:superfamily II DNA or RNA helicase
MIEDRPYQTDIIAEFHRTTARFKRIILVAPTAAGKTVIAAAIIKDFVKRRQEVLVLAHRREIIGQTSKKLRDLGIWDGVILAGEDEMPMAPVQLASVQTLWSRAMRQGPNGTTRMELPPATLVVVDECHHSTTNTWRKILNAYPDAIILGLTATPCRGDGRGLGGIFETMIECPQVAELIELGYLVKSRVYAPSTPDLTGVKVQAGDYVESQLAERMDHAKLVADIVGTWHKYGERRKTVVFATGVGHSIHLRDEFRASGVRAEHIDGGTPKDERDATLARLASGEIEVVTNCMVLTEGWDMPEVGCCILARPTKKMGLFRQMIGRALRPAPGKTNAIILDHSGAVFRHGLPEDRVDWTLDPDKTARSPDHEARTPETFGGPKLLDCTQCGALRQGGKACPNCGFLPVRKPELVQVREGDLALVTNGKPGKTEVNAREWLAMLSAIGIERGYKPGWAAHKFKEKFGRWPPSRNVSPIDPTLEVRSWVRSRTIAWARSQGRR